MDARSQLDQLLAALCDGHADAGAGERLCALLHAHPEWQDEYLAHLEVHALLQWRGGLAQPAAEPGQTVPASISDRMSRRRLAIALAFTAACVAFFFFLQPPAAQATAELLEQLVELNVGIAEAATPGERTRILAEQGEPLRVKLAAAPMNADDRKLAELLLENGAWLVENRDPVAVADRFGAIADQLVARMDAATAARDDDRMDMLVKSFERLTTAGIEPNLHRAAKTAPADRLHQVTQHQLRQAGRNHKVAEIIERNPDEMRKTIRRKGKKK